MTADDEDTDKVIEDLTREHREAFNALTAYRRTQRRVLVETTLDQLRKHFAAPSNLYLHSAPPPLLPMPDVMSDSIVNIPHTEGLTQSQLLSQPPVHHEQLSRDEVKRRIQMLYANTPPAISPVAASQQQHQTAQVNSDARARQQLVESIRKLYEGTANA